MERHHHHDDGVLCFGREGSLMHRHVSCPWCVLSRLTARLGQVLGAGRRLLPGLLLVLLAVEVAAADGQQWLRVDQSVPDSLAGTWRSLGDGRRVDLDPGQSLAALPVGAYQAGATIVYLRDGDDAGAYARALVGAPTLTADRYPHRVALAETGLGFDHLSFIIAVWRRADGLEWPWVAPDDGDRFAGVGWLCETISGRPGLHYDRERGVYVDDSGHPVMVVGADESASGPGPVVRPGDLISMVRPGDAFATIGMLVADHGHQGLLDPEDMVVSAQHRGGALADQIQILALGQLFGPQELHVRRRSVERLSARQQRDGRGLRHPLSDRSPVQQFMALLGMIIIIAVLMRRIRRHRRAQAQ